MGLDASLRFSVRVSILRPGISDRLTWPVLFLCLEHFSLTKRWRFEPARHEPVSAFRSYFSRIDLFFQEEPRGASNGRCHPCDRVPGTARGQMSRRDENLRNRRY